MREFRWYKGRRHYSGWYWPAIATCLLLPGKTTRAIHPGDGPHSHRGSVAINSILRSLTAARASRDGVGAGGLGLAGRQDQSADHGADDEDRA